METSGTG